MDFLSQIQLDSTSAALWLPGGVEGEHFRWMAPPLALVATIVLILVVPLITRRAAHVSAAIALGGAVVTTLLTYFVTLPEVQLLGQAGVTPADASPMFVADNLSVFFTLFVMLFLVLVIGLWLIGSAEREKSAPEFFVLLIGSALGMILMVPTLNLLMMVIALELASLPSYAIVGFDKRSKLGAEAALKYVIFGAISTAIMIYGVSLVYGYYGSLDLPVIADALHAGHGNVLVAVALFAMLVGVGFKISAVPFHFWCPDVFEGAKIEVTTWLSVTSKVAGLCLLVRIVYTFANPDPEIGSAANLDMLWPLAWGIGIVAAITCTIGNLAAYRQTSVKRMLAYSSVAHAGYMLMAGAVLSSVDIDQAHAAVSALVAYALIYLFMNLGAFGTVALVYWATGKETFDAFTGLGRRAPWLAVPMAVCLFSLVGMPPLGGFMVKFWLLKALFEAGAQQPLLLYSLVIIAVLNTLISLFYYLRVIREMFLVDDDQPAVEVPMSGLAMVNACAIVLVLTGTVMSNLVLKRSDSYATNLYVQPSRPWQTVTAEPEPVPASPARLAAGQPAREQDPSGQ